MKPVLCVVIVSSLQILAVQPVSAQPVQFLTSDSVTVFGDYYPAVEDDAPVILLFHQGGSNARAEYEPLAPRLNAEGFSALAVDLRSGGERFGGTNRTIEAIGDPDIGHCEAMPDVVATLDYALEHHLGSPVIVWGSSFSAALVIYLAADRPEDVSAVLAFSPAAGEPMAGCDPNEISGSVEVPLLALRPAREMEYEHISAQLAMLEEQGHQTYVAENGVHGSSMLNEARTESSTEATWEVVLGFLRSVGR